MSQDDHICVCVDLDRNTAQVHNAGSRELVVRLNHKQQDVKITRRIPAGEWADFTFDPEGFADGQGAQGAR